MPITVMCENPDCRQSCAVPDDHAGRIVRCPRCPALIQVPLHPASEQTAATRTNPTLTPGDEPFQFDRAAVIPANTDTPSAGTVAPSPTGEAAEVLAAFFRECRLSRAKVILLACALGCFLLMFLGSFLPWQNLRGRLLDQSVTRLGVATGSGAVALILTVLVIAFLITAVAMRHARMLEVAIWSCAGWAALSTLWRVIDIVAFHASDSLVQRSAAFGVYFCLLLSLAALGTAGTVAFTRLSSHR